MESIKPSPLYVPAPHDQGRAEHSAYVPRDSTPKYLATHVHTYWQRVSGYGSCNVVQTRCSVLSARSKLVGTSQAGAGGEVTDADLQYIVG